MLDIASSPLEIVPFPVLDAWPANRAPSLTNPGFTSRGAFERQPAAPPADLRFSVQIVAPAPVRRRGLAWQGIAAEVIEYDGEEPVEIAFNGPCHLLAVFDCGSRSDGESFVEGLPRSAMRDLARKLTFVPAGSAYREGLRPRSATRIIYFYLDPATLPVPLECRSPRLLFEDAMAWNTALQLAAVADDGAAGDEGYLNALGLVLLHELRRIDRGSSVSPSRAKGGLAAWQERIVAAHIEKHLADQVPLADLAGLVRLSPYHFARAFRQSFGVPPHRFHISRRIEQAKVLLAQRKMSVTDIGLEVGFNDTSAFTATFRKLTGTTPSSYSRGLGQAPA